MKLKSRRTGEIVDAKITESENKETPICLEYTHESEEMGGTVRTKSYFRSLEELNDEWETYKEEPREFYYITPQGGIDSEFEYNQEYVDGFKEIGNYFETEEEAEKALEKIETWKRLRDKGFRFDYESWKEGALDEIFYSWDHKKAKDDFIYKNLEIILKEEGNESSRGNKS